VKPHLLSSYRAHAVALQRPVAEQPRRFIGALDHQKMVARHVQRKQPRGNRRDTRAIKQGRKEGL